MVSTCGRAPEWRYSIRITELETRTSEQLSSTEESINITNRHPYYRYSYIVAAVTVGQGPYSAATLIHMPEAGKERELGTQTMDSITFYFDSVQHRPLPLQMFR